MRHNRCSKGGQCRFYTTESVEKFVNSANLFLREEIEVLHSGKVDGVVFESKNEMVNLNNTIKQYNKVILRHWEYKDNYWHNERYNESVAKLNLFEEIF